MFLYRPWLTNRFILFTVQYDKIRNEMDTLLFILSNMMKCGMNTEMTKPLYIPSFLTTLASRNMTFIVTTNISLLINDLSYIILLMHSDILVLLHSTPEQLLNHLTYIMLPMLPDICQVLANWTPRTYHVCIQADKWPISLLSPHTAFFAKDALSARNITSVHITGSSSHTYQPFHSSLDHFSIV